MSCVGRVKKKKLYRANLPNFRILFCGCRCKINKNGKFYRRWTINRVNTARNTEWSTKCNYCPNPSKIVLLPIVSIIIKRYMYGYFCFTLLAHVLKNVVRNSWVLQIYALVYLHPRLRLGCKLHSCVICNITHLLRNVLFLNGSIECSDVLM